MAFTAKCPFCGSPVSAYTRKCPECGAVNEYYVEHRESLPGAPETLEELQEYCAEREVPLDRMGFRLGEDDRSPCRFGIFEEAGVFTVYGNDPAGRRYVPYQGPDEKAGVRKLFAKLLDECHRLELYPENRQD